MAIGRTPRGFLGPNQLESNFELDGGLSEQHASYFHPRAESAGYMKEDL